MFCVVSIVLYFPFNKVLCLHFSRYPICYHKYLPTSLAYEEYMVSIMRVFMECKNGHFGVKFIILCDFF